jgi:hypothetical protein
MSDMIFKNRDDLSLLDQFRLHVRQRQIDEVLRRSYTIVQENLKALLGATEEDIEALVNMPPSERYSMDMMSERDQTSLKFRWFITISVTGKPANSYDHIFNDREKPVKDSSFRIIISPKHIGYEINKSGDRCMFRFVSSQQEDHKLELDNVNEEARARAIFEVRKALAEWIAHSCPDHAALFFMQQKRLLDLLEHSIAVKAQNDKKKPRLNAGETEVNFSEIAKTFNNNAMAFPEMNLPTVNLSPLSERLNNKINRPKKPKHTITWPPAN